MSGFGRPAASNSVAARGLKLEFLRRYFSSNAEWGIGPFSKMYDVASLVTTYQPQAMPPTSPVSVSWCERISNEKGNSIHFSAANLHVVVSGEDNFLQVISAIERAVEANLFSDNLQIDQTFVYFTFLDDRKIMNNGRVMSRIANCLVLLSSWEEPRVFREYSCFHALYHARSQNIRVAFFGEGLDESFVNSLIEDPVTTHHNFLYSLECAPSVGGLSSMDEMQFIRSTIVDVEDDRAAQVQQDRQMLKSILRKCGSQFTVNLLTSRLRQEDGSHDYSDYYNSLEFALIRVLYEVGETGIAQQRNEQLLMRLLVRHQQMTSSESATSSLIRLIISVLLCLTNQLSRDSRYREAEAALRQVLPIASQQLGSQDLAVLRLLKDIGASCRHQGKYMEAIGMLQSIMDQINAILNNSEMEEEVRKRWQGLYVEVMVEFACYYRNVNNLVDARNMLTSALEMAHTLFLPDNPLLRQIEGLVNRMDGRTADLLAKTIATHGAESKEYWKVLYDQGQDKINSHPVLAAELLLLAYELSRQLPEHGERHLLTTSCLQHHARALLVNGQIEEGMQKLFRCYELRKEIWTEYHDKTITTLFYYAGAVQQSGNLELALEYYQRCLVLENGAVQQQLMRPTNDLICATCNRIARLFDQLGNLEEARVFAEESYLRSVEGSGEGDPSTIARRRYWESLHQSRR